MKDWKHDELAEDLGDCKQTNFLNVHLGSPYLQYSVQRADVIEVKPSYTRFCVSIYEVKVSRSDFQSDIRSGKWKGYLDHCHRFYFAAPAGMVKKEEIPDEAGLIVRGENGWATVKPAKPRDIEIPYMTLLSILFVKQRRNYQTIKRSTIFEFERYNQRSEIYKALGKEVGDALRNRDEYNQAKYYYERKMERIDKIIAEGLGLKEGHYWSEESELRELVRKITEKVSA